MRFASSQVLLFECGTLVFQPYNIAISFFSPPRQEIIEVESENVFKLAAYALQVNVFL